MRISESPDQITVLREALERARALTGEVLSLNQEVKSQLPRSSCGESGMGWTNHSLVKILISQLSSLICILFCFMVTLVFWKWFLQIDRTLRRIENLPEVFLSQAQP